MTEKELTDSVKELLDELNALAYKEALDAIRRDRQERQCS